MRMTGGHVNNDSAAEAKTLVRVFCFLYLFSGIKAEKKYYNFIYIKKSVNHIKKERSKANLSKIYNKEFCGIKQ